MLYKMPSSCVEKQEPKKVNGSRTFFMLIKKALACLQGLVFLKYLPQGNSKLYAVLSSLLMIVIGVFYTGISLRKALSCLKRLLEQK